LHKNNSASWNPLFLNANSAIGREVLKKWIGKLLKAAREPIKPKFVLPAEV